MNEEERRKESALEQLLVHVQVILMVNVQEIRSEGLQEPLLASVQGLRLVVVQEPLLVY
jgi:hypothetical protein